MTRRSQSRVRYINRAQKKQVRCAPEVLGHRMNQPSLRKSAITVESVWEERDERDASPLTSQQRLEMQIVVNCCACSGAATEQGREKAGKTEDWREDWQSALKDDDKAPKEENHLITTIAAKDSQALIVRRRRLRIRCRWVLAQGEYFWIACR